MILDHEGVGMDKIVRVGVAVIIEKDDKVLMGLRKSKTHGNNTWQFPGGHLEYGESFEECAKREVKEETNLDVDDFNFIGVTNDFFEEVNKHYITIFLKAQKVSGNLRNMEPHKCERWEWIDKKKVKDMNDLFLPVKHLIENNMWP